MGWVQSEEPRYAKDWVPQKPPRMTKRSPSRYFKTSQEIIRLAVMRRKRCPNPTFSTSACFDDLSLMILGLEFLHGAAIGGSRFSRAEPSKPEMAR